MVTPAKVPAPSMSGIYGRLSWPTAVISARARSVLVLHDGQVRERGAAHQLLADEQSLFSRMSVREADRILPS